MRDMALRAAPDRCFTCGEKLEFSTRDGRLVARCRMCARRKAGLCRWCPAKRAGASWYCDACRAKERVLRGRRWYLAHAEEARASWRRRYKAARGRRSRTPADPRCIDCQRAIPWLRRGRPPKRCVPCGGEVGVIPGVGAVA